MTQIVTSSWHGSHGALRDASKRVGFDRVGLEQGTCEVATGRERIEKRSPGPTRAGFFVINVTVNIHHCLRGGASLCGGNNRRAA